MNAAAFEALAAVLDAAAKVSANLPAIREVLTTDQAERLDALHAQFADASNSVADRLRHTPPDQV